MFVISLLTLSLLKLLRLLFVVVRRLDDFDVGRRGLLSCTRSGDVLAALRPHTVTTVIHLLVDSEQSRASQLPAQYAVIYVVTLTYFCLRNTPVDSIL